MVATASARAFAAAASGLLGLAVGSFLNVVIYRLPLGMSVSMPASHCPKCQTPLTARDNVPVLSWLFLRGRCRHCKAAISPRYPLVELTTALAFTGLALTLHSEAALPSALLVTASSFAGAMIELDGKKLPPVLAITSGLGAASLVLVSVIDGGRGRLAWAALSALAALVCALATAFGSGLRLDGLNLTRPGGPDAPSISPAHLGVSLSLAWTAGWLWFPGGVTAAAGLVPITILGLLLTKSRRLTLLLTWVLATSMLLVGAAVGGA